VESVASQLVINNEANRRDPVYFDMSGITPATISHEHGAVVATLFLIVIGIIAYTRY